MNNPKNPKLGHNKKSFLEKPIEHIDITSFDSRKIIESMNKMSFCCDLTSDFFDSSFKQQDNEKSYPFRTLTLWVCLVLQKFDQNKNR